MTIPSRVAINPRTLGCRPAHRTVALHYGILQLTKRLQSCAFPVCLPSVARRESTPPVDAAVN